MPPLCNHCGADHLALVQKASTVERAPPPAAPGRKRIDSRELLNLLAHSCAKMDAAARGALVTSRIIGADCISHGIEMMVQSGDLLEASAGTWHRGVL